MDQELLKILNNFHTQLDEYEGEFPQEIATLFHRLNAFLYEHDPVDPE